jgi:hypothetical protein
MKLIIQILLILFFFIKINEIVAQTDKEKKEVNYEKSSLFNTTEPINIELLVNKKALFKDVEENQQYHHVLVKYDDVNENKKELNFKISTRGNFRKDPKNCNLPPLKLKIPKSISQSENPFSGQSKIKLVVPCRQGSQRFQECLILEYLVYKTYELLTDISFRTRLANIQLKDSSNHSETQNFMGFFLEESDQLAKRHDGKILKFKRYSPQNVNRQQMTMMAVFQYLIGNTDWSVDVSHNIELIFIQNQTTPFAIPFDFDWSGIVDASYAVPAEVLSITNVKQRLFRGYERSIEEYEPVIKLFNDKKQEIYNLYKNCEWLTEKTKKSTINYLDDFYEIINNPKLVEREFIKNCRKL